MSEWMISAENLSKKYKNASFYSVENMNLKIKRGAVFGILGPNGAGKTTTLSMLCGLLKPTSGRISFPQYEKQSDIRKSIGYVPQELALYPKLTARENLEFFGNLYGLDKKTIIIKSRELLDLVGLERRADEFIQNYSTGMKRRINLAAGLMHAPGIILLDEPTVGIDPQSRNCIYEAIAGLKSEGRTILYTTHYMEEASKLCDIVAIMDNGGIIMEGSPAELVKDHGSHRIYFGYDKKPGDALISDLKKIPGIKGAAAQETVIIVSISNTADNMEIMIKIKSTAFSENINLSVIKIEEPNLENLFLDLTGRTLRDENAQEG